MPTLFKDPDEIRYFTINWAGAIPSGASIATSSWEVESGDATIGDGARAPTSGATTTTVWVVGGTAGVNVKLINTITTDESPSETYEEALEVKVRNS